MSVYFNHTILHQKTFSFFYIIKINQYAKTKIVINQHIDKIHKNSAIKNNKLLMHLLRYQI